MAVFLAACSSSSEFHEDPETVPLSTSDAKGRILKNLERMGVLLDSTNEASTDPEHRSDLERLALETADLAALPAFAAVPLARQEIQTLVLFAGKGPVESRREAWARCRSLALELPDTIPPTDPINDRTTSPHEHDG